MIDPENTNPFFSEEEIELYKQETDKKHFKSRYQFLNSHNGHKLGKTHLYLGTAGGGKSTMARSLITDACVNLNSKEDHMTIWLSEESVEDYVKELYVTGLPFEFINRLKIYSELSDGGKNKRDVLKRIEWVCKNRPPKIFFYDNITTSVEYETVGQAGQVSFYSELKRIAYECNIPFIVLAHTKADVTENYNGIIDMNQIRGSKSVPNMAEFFYVMQSFFIGEKRINTVRLTKFRGSPVDHRLYRIEYCPHMRIFKSDMKLDFQEFERIFKQRNKL